MNDNYAANWVALPAGGSYRVYASRGTEWSADSAAFAGTASGTVTLHLRHVVDTTGYLGAEFHVHQVASPDSPVGSDERVRSALSAGVELFAVTDHDVVSDLQPFVAALNADDLLRVVPGIEVTPFPYGHFNAYPLDPQASAAGQSLDVGRSVGLVGCGKGVLLWPAFHAAHHLSMEAIWHHARHLGAVVPEVRGEEDDSSARPQHACQLRINRLGLSEVLEHTARHDEVDAGAFQRQVGQISVVHLDAIRHIGEVNQFNTDQPLHLAEIVP